MTRVDNSTFRKVEEICSKLGQQVYAKSNLTLVPRAAVMQLYKVRGWARRTVLVFVFNAVTVCSALRDEEL